MSNSSSSPHAARPASWPSGLVYRAWKMWLVRVLILAILLVVAFFLGGLILGRGGANGAGGAGGAPVQAAAAPEFWTCSMHPQIKQPGPGQCPICFMDLIPVQAGGGDADVPQLSLSERARVLARVATTPVENREVTHELHMVGKVTPDETRITYVSSYIPGRIDRLFVNYTGILVRQGDHLAEIYSPDLLVGQREYLLALENAERTRDAAADSPARKSTEALTEAARRKLELWGVPEDELERLVREGTPTDHVRIDAPEGGWVLERQAYEGMYVETGTRLFTLADLRTVWVLLDAYELELSLLRYGQRVEFETEAYPGRKFEGRISYIDPRLTELTRTVKVRVNVVNEDMQLRPGLFVRAVVRVRVGEGGQVIEPSLTGKWICPMHPEIVKDGPAGCDVCGMDLVTAESLGFATQQTPGAKALAIPQTAVLLTGRRAVVYVETENADGEPVYEGREVELGPRAGEWYVVRSGLAEGERVVTHGAFQIDSALQIQAKPSMMQPAQDAASAAGTQPAEPELPTFAVAGAAYHESMRPVIQAYLRITKAASADNPEIAPAVAELRSALVEVRPQGLAGAAADAFQQRISALRQALPESPQPTLDQVRNALPALTAALEAYLRSFGHDQATPLYRHFCPMAFDDRGAAWLQADDQVRNPYFGAVMYRCGVVRGAIGPDGKETRR